jgi:hypothetical protein
VWVGSSGRGVFESLFRLEFSLHRIWCFASLENGSDLVIFFGCARRLRQGYVARRVVVGWFWFTKGGDR